MQLTRTTYCRLAAVTVTAVLLGLGAWASAGPTKDDAEQDEGAAEEVDLEALGRQIDSLKNAARKLADSESHDGPRTVEGVLRRIRGADTPERIFNWVRNNIRFEPYLAAMRGPKGVLEARAGNAADQARLLAALLKEAGHDYRFATGQLPTVDSRELVERYARQASLVTTDEVAAREALATEEAVGRQRFLNLVQDHVWVEAMADDEWTAADPVLAGSFGGVRIKPEAHHQTLPRKHSANLEVSLRASFADGQQKRVMTIEGPMSRFAYQAIELQFRPSQETENTVIPEVRLGDQSKEGERFLPEELEVLVLEYHARVGQVERLYEHVLFRKDSDNDSLFQHDDAVVSVSVLPGWTSKTRLADLAGQAIDDATETLEAALPDGSDGGSVNHQAADAADRAVLQAAGVIAPLVYAHHLDRLTEQLAYTLGTRPVLLQPRIIRAMMVRDGATLSADLDIRGGQLEALPRKGIPESAATGFLTLFGRVEAQIRRAMVQKLIGRKQVTVDSIFERVQNAHVPISTIHNDNVDRLENIDVPNQTRKVMRNQVVQRGWLLLTPMRPVKIGASKHFGWWSVEPLTGLMRGNLAGALADLQTVPSEEKVAPSAMLGTGTKLLARLHRTTKQTLAGKVDYTGLVCEALDATQLISRSLCATQKLLSLPEISACGQGGGQDTDSEGGGDAILGLSRQSCNERVAKTRCGAAVASAFLKGRLAPMYSKKESGRMGELAEFSCVGR